MKANNSGVRKNLIKIVLLSLIIVLSLFTLISCNNNGAKVAEIAIEKNEGVFVLGDFKISDLTIKVTFEAPEGEEPETEIINCELSMLSTEAKQSLLTAGEKSVTINYKGKTVIADFRLVEGETDVLKVDFYEADKSTLIATRYAVSGDSITPPNPKTIENKTFVGWYTADNKQVTLTNITQSYTLYATYTTETSTYSVKCVDYKGDSIGTELKINSGDSISSSLLPTYDSNKSKYPELKGWSWAIPSGKIYGDTIVSMIPDFNYYSVLFAYQIEGESNVNYLEKYSTTVKYNTNVGDTVTNAQKDIVSLGYTIKTTPSTNTTIRNDSKFVFIVSQTEINIKVYRDANATSILDTVTRKIGTEYKLPTTAASVTGSALEGWKVKNKNKTIDVGGTWVVTSEYGTTVEFIPKYVSITIPIQFYYELEDQLVSGNKYKINITTSEFVLKDIVTFSKVQSILDELNANKLAYKAELNNKTGNLKYKVSDNGGENVRTIVFGDNENAGTISQYTIVSIKYASNFVTPDRPQSIANSDTPFEIVLSKSTKQLTYSAIMDNEAIVGYKVTGVDGLAAGSIISMPDSYKPTEDAESKPVLSIGTSAFTNGYTIAKLSSNLTTIEASAFKNCILLGDIDLTKVTTIGESAFENTTFSELNGRVANLNLEQASLVGNKAFFGATINVDISFSNEEYTTIGTSLFENAKGNIALTFNKVETIGVNAFKNSEFTTISGFDNVTAIGESAFEQSKVETLSFTKLTAINSKAFKNIKTLKQISIDGAVAFDLAVAEGDNELNVINIGKDITAITLTGIDNFANIEAINVNSENANYYSDEGVLYSKSTTEYALVYYPTARFDVYSPNLTSGYTKATFDGTAFNSATVAILYLQNVDKEKLTIGNNATTGKVYAVILHADSSDEVINKCKTTFSCTSVYKDGETTSVGFYNQNGTKLVYKVETIVANNAPSNETTNTPTITIIAADSNATEITIPASINNVDVTRIENGVFKNFTKLEKLHIQSNNIKYWDKDILEGCTKLVEFEIAGFDEDASVSISDFEGNAWYDSNNLLSIGGKIFYNNNAKDQYGNAKTTINEEESKIFGNKIPDGFFKKEENANYVINITDVVLNSDIHVIGKEAFSGCSQLTTITFKGDITKIGEQAFYNCSSLKEIIVNKQGSTISIDIDKGAFKNCTNLVTASIYGMINKGIQAGLYSLPVEMFNGCSSLTEFNYEYADNFDKDADGARTFQNCSSLKSFDFTKIKSNLIPKETFNGCTGLSYLDFNDSNIEQIGISAFENCTGIMYINLSSNITIIGEEAFKGLNKEVIVELPYTGNAGLYLEDATISANSFDSTEIDAKIDFYINGDKPTVFNSYTDAKYTFHINGSDYPNISYQLANTLPEEKKVNFSMADSSKKVFLRNEDVEAPNYDGYTFVGWYSEEDAQEASKVTFPKIFKESKVLYAKYYINTLGSLKDNNVKYVYLIMDEPYVELKQDLLRNVDNESVLWTIRNTKSNSGEIVINSFPYIVETTKDDKESFVLKAYIGIDSNQDGTLLGAEINEEKEFNNVGIFGYAIVNYSEGNLVNISLPNTYDDDVNGEADVIALYSGAFNADISGVDANFLPNKLKAIFNGVVTSTNIAGMTELEKTKTFNSNLKLINIPRSVEYIGDGVFSGLAETNITFEEGSLLKYASVNTFYGSKWYLEQLESLDSTNGFILAGNLAVQYFGSAKVVDINSGVAVNTLYNLDPNVTDANVTLTILKKNTSIPVSTTAKIVPEKLNDVVTKYVLTIENLYTLTIYLNSNDTQGEIREGYSFVVMESESIDNILAVLVDNVENLEVSIPINVTKLNDSIFEGNKEINSVIFNNNLITIGKNAFKNSSLTSILYGTANDEQWRSKIESIGKNAFTGSAFYGNNVNVIVGTIYIKFNNTTARESLTINDAITEIAPYAFANLNKLKNLTITSNKLTKVGEYAFFNSALTSITLPSNVDTILKSAFSECKSLSNLNLSNTKINVVNDGLFENCTSLTSLSLPNTVTTLQKNSLNGCAKLTTIVANGIESLSVKVESTGDNVKYESALEQTSWYKISQSDDNQLLTLGNVLVKFVLGKNSITYSKATVVVGENIDANTYYELNNRTYSLTTDLTFASGKDYYIQSSISIDVPNGIKTISTGAFFRVDNVEKITLSNTVVTIDDYAFGNMKDIKEIVFGTDLAHIKAFAFINDTNLEKAVLPEGLVEIGEKAFYNSGIKSEVRNANNVRIEDNGFVIPVTVKKVGASAFEETKNITYFVIGENLVEIGEKAFATNGNLYKVLWNIDYDKLSEITEYIGNTESNKVNGTTIFTSNVTDSIRIYTSTTVSADINDRSGTYYSLMITDYGWNIFAQDSYPSISFDGSNYTLEGIKAEYITEDLIPTPVHNYDQQTNDSYTFMGWYLNSDYSTPLVYPYYVYKDMELKAKWYKNNIDNDNEAGDGTVFTTLPQSNGKVTISNINISNNPSGVVYIPNTIRDNLVVGLNITEDIPGIRKLIITQGSNFNGMTENIFKHLVDLEEIEIKYISNVTAIDYKVVKVTIGNDTKSKQFSVVYSNENNADYGNKLIAFIGNVSSLGLSETELNSVLFNIPNGVTTVFENAFSNSGIRYIGLPSSLQTIGENGLGENIEKLLVYDNIYLTDVTLDSIYAQAPIREKAIVSTTFEGYKLIEGLKYKGADFESTFYILGNIVLGLKIQGITEGSTLTFPTNVAGIDLTVIASNINVDGIQIKITSTLALPTNLIKINKQAFNNINLEGQGNITVGNNLNDIADEVFGHMNYYEERNDTIRLGTVLIRYLKSASGRVDAASLSGITAISSGAFKQLHNITSVELPARLTVIGAEAFYNCENLETVIIPDSVVTISDSAFDMCTNLTTVTINTKTSGLSTIGNNAFKGCKELIEIRLPANLKTIGNSAFEDCTALKTVTFVGFNVDNANPSQPVYTEDAGFPSKLISMGDSTFNGCVSLEDIVIPNPLTEIPTSCFDGCISLATVTFGAESKLTVINENAFKDCESLGKYVKEIPSKDGAKFKKYELCTLSLPNSLIEIKDGAFSDCENLWGVEFNYHIGKLGSNIFSGCKNLVKLLFRRATPPDITKETFPLVGGNYRLRIYIIPGGTTTDDSAGQNGAEIDINLKNFRNKWSALVPEITDYLYVNIPSAKPTAKFTITYNDQNESRTEDIEVYECDAVDAKLSFVNGSASKYKLATAKLKEQTQSVTRENATVRVSLDSTHTTDIVVLDFDRMEFLGS